MTRNRFRTRFFSLLAILTTAMSGLIVQATSAAAMRLPDPAQDSSNVVFVPSPPVTQIVHDSQGLQWWAIALIAVAVAVVAAGLTELYHAMHHRSNDVTLSPA